MFSQRWNAVVLGALGVLGLGFGLPAFGEASGRGPRQDGGGAPAQAGVRDDAVPFLWRIEGHGATAFLYGTVHLPDPRVLKLSPVVESAFGEADAFYAEIDDSKQNEAEFAKLGVLGQGLTIQKLVDAATWKRIEARFAAAGHGPGVAAQLGVFKPWVFGAFLAKLEYLEDEMSGKAPLDRVLYRRAQKAGKRVGALESVAEQVGAFEVFSMDEQLKMLKESLDQLDEYEADGRDAMQELVSAWLSGDEAQLIALLDDGFGKDPEIRTRAEDSVLWGRNRRMAVRIDRKMREHMAETGFFAVGALHLPDAAVPELAKDASPDEVAAHPGRVAEAKRKHGIVTILRKKGYRVTRVTADAKEPAAVGGGK